MCARVFFLRKETLADRKHKKNKKSSHLSFSRFPTPGTFLGTGGKTEKSLRA